MMIDNVIKYAETINEFAKSAFKGDNLEKAKHIYRTIDSLLKEENKVSGD